MDIQKENKLIQEAFEIKAEEIGFCLDQMWGDYENPYENSDTALAFNLFKKGWKAKAQKVAVPECQWVKNEDGMYDTSCKNTFVFHDSDDTPKNNDFKNCCFCGGLIEAQEQAG